MRLFFNVDCLVDNTLKLGVYGTNAMGMPISMASYSLSSSFVYGLPYAIDHGGGEVSKTEFNDEFSQMKLDFRINIPETVTHSFRSTVRDLNLDNGYTLILECPVNGSPIESDALVARNRVELELRYKSIWLRDQRGHNVFKHTLKARRGKNRKHYK